MRRIVDASACVGLGMPNVTAAKPKRLYSTELITNPGGRSVPGVTILITNLGTNAAPNHHKQCKKYQMPLSPPGSTG